jgi:hypothetical protein
MARPRVINMGEGVVKLQGFTKEQADILEKLILTGPSDVVQESVAPVVVAEESKQLGAGYDEQLPDVALGLRKVENNYQLVTIKYGVDVDHAMILDVKNLGSNKFAAHDKFKEQVVKKGLIKP